MNPLACLTCGYVTTSRDRLIDHAAAFNHSIAAIPKRRVAVTWDGEEVRTVDLDVFVADNAADPFTCAAVVALKPGESVTLGGGAAPLLVVVALP